MEKRDRLEAICRGALESADLEHMAGLALGASVGDEVFTGAAGFRNAAAGAGLTAEDVFHCASISKTFTSTGIMKLADEGKLSLDDRLAELLPYMSIADKRWEKIRLHHMLSHISGLHDVEELDWSDPQTDEGALKRQALSDGVRSMTLSSDPDDGIFLYSDLCYDLLGLIIQEVSGKPFETFVADEFIRPAGMENTTFLTFERTGGSTDMQAAEAAGLAMPHRCDADGRLVLESVYPYSREHAPSSTLTSTVGDLLRWAQYNMAKKAVSEAAYERMQTERVDAVDKNGEMGMGWFIWNGDGFRLVGHEGGDIGFRTSFWTWPDKEAAIVILSNTTEAPIEQLNEQLIREIAREF